MTKSPENVAAATEMLCERCGYALTGLPEGANCPECGMPTAESSPALRGLSTWEKPGNFAGRLFSSTMEVLFLPKRFYRSLATRVGREQSSRFGILHSLLASVLFATAGFIHFRTFFFVVPGLHYLLYHPEIGLVCFVFATFFTLIIATRIAARLTNWEATYRGYRLPLPVVLRGLDFHAAHYLPVALLSAITVLGYRYVSNRRFFSMEADEIYLYTLCGEVIVGAVYLFWTYWIAMRNMMFANA